MSSGVEQKSSLTRTTKERFPYDSPPRQVEVGRGEVENMVARAVSCEFLSAVELSSEFTLEHRE